MKNIEKLALNWVNSDKIKAENIVKSCYCPTRDIFQARLDKMVREILYARVISEGDSYVISAITGEIGNNSFDHNLGSWPDVMGIFFCYTINKEIKIVLADRGQGVLKTLKAVKPDLQTDKEALKVAFTEKISGRAPENRGNGLKFVRENIQNRKMRLHFSSGNAKIELNDKMKIFDTDQKIKGCLAIIES